MGVVVIGRVAVNLVAVSDRLRAVRSVYQPSSRGVPDDGTITDSADIGVAAVGFPGSHLTNSRTSVSTDNMG